jgi:hypothetical protein
MDAEVGAVTSDLTRLAQQINSADRITAGDLLRIARARVIAERETTSWSDWVRNHIVGRGLRDCQRLMLDAKERAAEKRHKSVVCPVDEVLAEQNGLVLDDVAFAEPDVAELAEIMFPTAPDVAQPDQGRVPEPAIPAPPRAALKLATLWLAIDDVVLRRECLEWVEGGMVDRPLFVVDLQAAVATYDLRYEALGYSDEQARQAFINWARSLPEPRQFLPKNTQVRP